MFDMVVVFDVTGAAGRIRARHGDGPKPRGPRSRPPARAFGAGGRSPSAASVRAVLLSASLSHRHTDTHARARLRAVGGERPPSVCAQLDLPAGDPCVMKDTELEKFLMSQPTRAKEARMCAHLDLPARSPTRSRRATRSLVGANKLQALLQLLLGSAH